MLFANDQHMVKAFADGPISRSMSVFCHGDRSAIGRFRMLIVRKRLKILHRQHHGRAAQAPFSICFQSSAANARSAAAIPPTSQSAT